MASRHQQFLDAGVRIVGISIDSPGQQADMVAKLDLPFPLLSDPDGTAAIDPFNVRNQDDPRGLAKPALVLIGPAGDEVWRFVSRDFAERLPEDEVADRIMALGLDPVQAQDVTFGPREPGRNAVSLDDLHVYFRGAKFAALAMGLRHREESAAIKDDSKAFVALMDDYVALLT